MRGTRKRLFRRDAETNAPIRLAALTQGRLTTCLRSGDGRAPRNVRKPGIAVVFVLIGNQQSAITNQKSAVGETR